MFWEGPATVSKTELEDVDVLLAQATVKRKRRCCALIFYAINKNKSASRFHEKNARLMKNMDPGHSRSTRVNQPGKQSRPGQLALQQQ